MDLVANVDRFPNPGETLIGREFNTYPGGKGANQAVAARRLGAEVRIFGKVGDDLFGEQYLKHLRENGVITDGVIVEKGVSTGIAVIEVDGWGENHIVVIPGANNLIDPAYIDRQFPEILKSDIFLFQLEIPIETVVYAMRKLREHGKTVILDPAPAGATLPEDLFQYVDYLTPNESELALMSGARIGGDEKIQESSAWFLQKGVKAIVLKAGEAGAYLLDETDSKHLPDFPVHPLDTTGAGDSFNGGLAVALARGDGPEASIRFANAVGALATLAQGAQSAMPKMEEVEAFLKRH
jgi:ribokinase